ncbi:unnamed protein product [Moneuplotes crassus]|uniref:Uncharacterized protein n=1 Tax=Euplotes crassus TaxID=5936 RepID=A0AAD1U7S1_EUPCR|nr:unnamed protein product [Moneuplotes crassus]
MSGEPDDNRSPHYKPTLGHSTQTFDHLTAQNPLEEEFCEEIVLDKETEREVIETLHLQNQKIEEYEETITDLRLKVSQLDVYKQQVSNLQSQIKVLDEKFKLTSFDTENAKIHQLQSCIEHLTQKEQAMSNEAESKTQEIKYLTERVEEKNGQIRDLRRQLERKEEICGEMNLDVSAIQTQMQSKEQDWKYKVEDLQKRNEHLLTQNKTLEENIQELNNYIEENQREIQEFSMSVSTKESALSKLRKEVEKYKRERDEANKRAKSLIKDSQQASFLESQIKEFSKTIDKLSKDTDYEKKKNSKIVKENASLRKELERIQKKISGSNDPSSLKSRLGESQNKLSVASTTLTQKEKECKDLEMSLNEKKSEVKEILAYTCSYITSIMTWIDNSFLTILQGYSEDLERDYEEKPDILRIYDSVPEQLSLRKGSKSKHNLLGHLESLKSMLTDTKVEVVKKFKKERKKYSSLKAQMQETSSFKDDIITDFENLKEEMLKVEKDLNLKKSEVETHKSNVIDLKDQLKRKEDFIQDFQQDNTRFIWGAVYSLFSIKQKFDGSQLIKDSVDKLQKNIPLMDTLSKEINDPERYKGLTLEEKKEAIMHLISIINDITTTLHTETQRLSENKKQVKDLKHKLEQKKLEFDLKRDEILNQKEAEISTLRAEFEEKYDKFIETNKQEVSAEKEEVQKELDSLLAAKNEVEQQAECLKTEVEDLRKELKFTSKSNGYMKNILCSLLYRAEELVFQKNLLKKEYSFLSNQLGFCNEEVEKLKEIIENLNERIALKSMKESMLDHIRNQKDMSMSISDLEHINLNETRSINKYTKIMKFRKSVIVVMAINRMKLYSQGYYGKSLTTLKSFKDINFSSDSHYNEISKKIRMLSIPERNLNNDLSILADCREESGSLSPRNDNQKYPKFETVSNMELTLNNEYGSVTKKLYTEPEYDPLKSISESKNNSVESDEDVEKYLVPIVDHIIEWQNNINKTRFQVTQRKRNRRHNNDYHSTLGIIQNYNICDLYETLPQLLVTGLRPIRHFMKSLTEKQILKNYLESCTNYSDPLPYDTQYLLFVFLPAQYMAKGCYSLDSGILTTKKKISTLEHRLTSSEEDLQRTQDTLESIEREAIDFSKKNEQYESLIRKLNQEKEDMVDKGEYENLLAERHQIYLELNSIKHTKDDITQQLKLVTEAEKGNESKVNEISIKLTETLHKLETVVKEKDLANLEIKSLNNILAQKDSLIKEKEIEKSSSVSSAKDLENAIKKLRLDRENLIHDNTDLLKENKKLHSNIIELNDLIALEKQKYLEREDPHPKVPYFSSGSKDFHNTGHKTAEFQYSEEKENSSINSIRNIRSQEPSTVPLYGMIEKNRSLSKNR